MTTTCQNIGQRIRVKRALNGLSRGQLASLAALPAARIKAYEYGDDNIKMDKLKRIADALEVHVLYFFHRV